MVNICDIFKKLHFLVCSFKNTIENVLKKIIRIGECLWFTKSEKCLTKFNLLLRDNHNVGFFANLICCIAI